MPQTSTDWAFWVFSTILVGFLLNVAAGLAANPISEVLARRRIKNLVPVLPSSEQKNSSPQSSDNPSETISIRAGGESFRTLGAVALTAADSLPDSSQEHVLSALSKEIDQFHSELRRSYTERSRAFSMGSKIPFDTYSDINPPPLLLYNRYQSNQSRSTWLLVTVFSAIALVIAWFAARFSTPVVIQAAALLVAAILLVVSLALLVRYIRRRIVYKPFSIADVDMALG